jgi:hypothetical protein
MPLPSVLFFSVCSILSLPAFSYRFIQCQCPFGAEQLLKIGFSPSVATSLYLLCSFGMRLANQMPKHWPMNEGW